MKWPIMIRRVQGESMLPLLRPGKLVVGWRWFGKLQPRDVVIVSHNGLEKIKRVQDIKAGQVFVVGDNPAQSTDSRDFGWLGAGLVRAKVINLRVLNRVVQKRSSPP
jgi:hypothetical protein